MEIFTYCLPEDSVSCRSDLKKVRLLLRQICRGWKQIAESSPRLWAFMHFTQYLPSGRAVPLAGIWLRRSGACPLSVCVRGNWSERGTHPVLDILVPHCERWEHLALDMTYPMTKQLSGVKDRLPRLRSLSINPLSPLPIPLQVFQSAPQLRSLRIGRQLAADAIKLPWHLLTKLVINGHPSHIVMLFLHNCPNLVECELRDIYDLLAPAASPLTLTYLRKLLIIAQCDSMNILRYPRCASLN
jgi:hypothetical protein